jgi:isoaspartyl peptidase/L-asparaginase-like protein (Ntn-hydrolase superfamily)
VDPEAGAACATGLGEEVMATVGSFLVVELMRRGASAADACREAIGRIARRHAPDTDVQVGYLGLDRHGGWGACSLKPGFQCALRDGSRRELVDAPSWF